MLFQCVVKTKLKFTLHSSNLQQGGRTKIVIIVARNMKLLKGAGEGVKERNKLTRKYKIRDRLFLSKGCAKINACYVGSRLFNTKQKESVLSYKALCRCTNPDRFLSIIYRSVSV